MGNIYVADEVGYKIRKINGSTGLIYTVAGIGTYGFSGDNGLAINAKISSTRSIRIDGAGNLYLGDYGNSRIRKVNAATGIITTVAGGGSSTADGILATNASLNLFGMTVDLAGNIYTTDGNKIRKVNATTGIITTVAGNGNSGDGGDNGPAVNATINGPGRYVMTDLAGNVYFLNSGGSRLRKIDGTTGIITLIAGGGSSNADSCLATNFSLNDCHSFSIDPLGNVIILDRTNSGKIRKVDAATGIMTLIAGGGSSTAEGVPATSANLSNYHWLHIDMANNMYITNWSYGTPYVRKINGSPSFANDSFATYINHLCSGPQITTITHHYTAGMTLKTFFGDGQVSIATITNGVGGGYVSFNHNYASSGTYTIKQVLYNGSIIIDSLHLTYHHVFCSGMPVKFYYDANNNCIKDSSENFLSQPVVTEVDSNGVQVAQISSVSGFYYTAYGNPGDIYTYKVITTPAGLHPTCPSTGIIYDTLHTTFYNSKTAYIGLSCISSTGFDLAVNPVIPVTGRHDQWGNIYVSNTYCMPTNATVTLHFSPKYVYNTGWAHPTPSSVSGNTITWNLNNVNNSISAPIDLYYAIWSPSNTFLTAGDTVQEYISISPITGDANPANNIAIIVDTVRGSCDPNEMAVAPTGNVLAGTQLQYTIMFENTGNDTAFNIYVMDTLSDNVDINSLRIVEASAVMDIAMLRDSMGHNIVKFDYPGINLLDSSHHDACNGAVIFTIKTKNGLPFGTKIFNHAGIFFDDNGVVMTDTVENIIGWPAKVNNIPLSNNPKVYPNPISNELTIEGADAGTVLHICNIIGQQMYTGTVSCNKQTIDTKELSKGVYLLQLLNKDGSKQVRKIVKE